MQVKGLETSPGDNQLLSVVSGAKTVRLIFTPTIPVFKSRIDAETKVLADRIRPQDVVLLQFQKNAKKPSIAQDESEYWIWQIPYRSYLGTVIKLSRLLKRLSPKYLHCHTLIPALVGNISRILNPGCHVKAIFEIEGATAFESLYRNRHRWDRYLRFLVLYLLENVAILLSHRLLLVSHRLESYYPLVKLKKRVAIPRLVTPGIDHHSNDNPVVQALQEFATRARKEGRLLIAYSGGAAHWQMIPEMVTLINHFCERETHRGVILTTQPDEFRRIVHSSPNTNETDWFIDHVPHEQIIPALRQCDYGIILREDIILNRVASPTKLYEYLYAGLALITTKGVPEGLDIIRELGVGVSVDLGRLHDAQYLDSLLPGLERAHRAHVKLAGLKERFTFMAGAKPLLELYEINQQV